MPSININNGLVNNKWCIFVLIYILFYISTINIWFIKLGANNIPRIIYYSIIGTGIVLYFWDILKKQYIFRFFLLFFLYIFYCFFCIFLAEQSSLEAAYPYIILPSIMLSGYSLLKRVDLIFLTKCIAIASTVIAPLTMYEYFTKSYLLPTENDPYVVFRSRVFADSCLSLGCEYAIGALLCIAIWKKTKHKIWFVYGILNIIGLLFTQSRGPLVGCLVGIIILAWYDAWINRTSRKLFFMGTIALVAIIIFMIINSFGLITIDNPIISRIISIGNWDSDEGNIGRLFKWRAYSEVFLQSPIIGHGIGYVDNSRYGVTESGIIQQLVEIGILGTVLYYSFIIKILKYGDKYAKCNPNGEGYLIVGLIAACVCVLVENCVLQIFDNTIIGTLFWLFLSIIWFVSEGEIKRKKF